MHKTVLNTIIWCCLTITCKRTCEPSFTCFLVKKMGTRLFSEKMRDGAFPLRPRSSEAYFSSSHRSWACTVIDGSPVPDVCRYLRTSLLRGAISATRLGDNARSELFTERIAATSWRRQEQNDPRCVTSQMTSLMPWLAAAAAAGGVVNHLSRLVDPRPTGLPSLGMFASFRLPNISGRQF